MVQGQKYKKWLRYGAFLAVMGFCSLPAQAGLFFGEDPPTKESISESAKKFLPGCFQVGHDFEDGRLVLNPVKLEEYDQTLYFIQNTYPDNIKVKFNRTEDTALYPLWRTNIKVDRWAAFATDIKGLSFNCFIDYGRDNARQIDCQRAVKVCQYPRAKFGQNNKGNYWLSTNHSKKGMRNKAIRKGILLRW